MDGISVSGIYKHFDGTTALSDINLSVRKGEFLSILGPSGCGKSTLLRIIAGLEEPSSGEVVIAGRTVTRDPVWKRKIGFVFQSFALWPHLTVLGNVAMGLELRGDGKAERREKALAALRLVQLESFADRFPSQLSGGQQQRVAVARAVVLEPAVLLLDEPLSSLDKNLRQDMQIELKKMQELLKLTTIFVTHDQEEAISLSDRIVVMNRGVIEQIDVPDKIYNWPASPYVARFVGETTFFEGRIERGDQDFMLCAESGTRIPLQQAGLAGIQEGVAFVRPEWIKLSKPNQDAGALSLRGMIERIMFFGATTDYLVRQGETLIRVRVAGGSGSFEVGDEVALNFAARLLPKR
jgi:ABC-type Fe3+/spermidine/putrescine transport system ATPase subunit